MRNKLVSIKRIVENEIGERIDTRNRTRYLTYARAVYCKTGRDMGLSLSSIGKEIKRDHATVLHNLNNIFDFAMQDPYYRRLYQTLSAVFQIEQTEEVNKQDFDAVLKLSEKVEELQKENDALRHKLLLLKENENGFSHLFEGLTKGEVDDVYNKLNIFVKAIKGRVYSYA
jgi:phenylacetate-coenzyme A ligase PaaK-like adenylate-forming protein